MKKRLKAKSNVLSGVSLLLLTALLSLMSAGHASAAQPRFCTPTRTANSVDAAAIGPQIKGISVALQAKQIAPGQSLYARPLNQGESWANYGPVYRIERYSGSGWTIDPSSPDGPWIRKSWSLAPERAGRCFGFGVPSDQPTGLYRFVIPVTVDGIRAARTAVFNIRWQAKFALVARQGRPKLGASALMRIRLTQAACLSAAISP
jgi:hypothetical protein